MDMPGIRARDGGSDPFGLDGLAAMIPPDAPEIRVAEGETICRSGDLPEMWWLVVDGFADVTRAGRYLGTVGPGETIGEMSMIDGRSRSATVVATSEMRLRLATANEFVSALRSDPDAALAVARLLARRLREVTGRVVDVGKLPHAVSSRERRAVPTPAVDRDATQAAPAPDIRAASPRSVGDHVRVVWDPFAPGYFDDPTVQLNAIREQEPIHRVEATDAYMFTRYEHVHALARDRRLGRSIDHALPNPHIDAERAMLASAPALSLLRRDGDEHARIRRLLQPAFTPKVIADWRARTAEVTEMLLDRLAGQAGGDLIGDFALQLPVQIITDMLGLPTGDARQLCGWSHAITKTLDPICTAEERSAAASARQEMVAYLEQMYADRRRRPDDRLLSQLIAAEADGERLTRAEVIVHASALFTAGHETTTNLIGNGAVELLRHPDQRALSVADPGLDANLVEEVLRFAPPVQMTRRISFDDVDVAGTHIPAGSVIELVAAAANRDPRKWGETADEFRVDRPGANDQVTFGGGPHFCLGAALARLEGQVALPRLFRRFPTLRLTDEPRFEARISLRGVAHMPVEL